MAEQRAGDRRVQFEHAFDRLLALKLEQVYGILVREWVRAIGLDRNVRGKRDVGCHDLRQRIFRAAEGGEHDRQSDGGADRLRTRAGYSVPDDWVILAAPVFCDPGWSDCVIWLPKVTFRRF